MQKMDVFNPHQDIILSDLKFKNQPKHDFSDRILKKMFG